MTFQAVRAVFEVPVINALAALTPTVPCYVDNQLFTTPDAGQEYGTIDLQFGATTSRTLTGNSENLRGSLVVECFTAKNTGPARAQEMEESALGAKKPGDRAERGAVVLRAVRRHAPRGGTRV